jgi:hypothetical protein
VLEPVVLGALVILAVNDQLLKAAWPGPVSGVLSDIAGLIVAPVALQAVWETVTWAVGRWRGPSAVVLGVAAVIVGVGFTALQLWPPATDLYRFGLGALQWPIAALVAALGGSPAPPVRPVVAVADVGDLVALPILVITTWWLARRRSARVVRDAAPDPGTRVGPAAPPS